MCIMLFYILHKIFLLFFNILWLFSDFRLESLVNKKKLKRKWEGGVILIRKINRKFISVHAIKETGGADV